ncbi:MAG: methyltransferase domain-containing protein [Anaerolineae bacterium]|nr:methyltransferase domain-containing protein [Anaerolineae bacterium]
MAMGKTETHVVNSRIRQLFQKHYEFAIIEKHLKRHNIDLAGKTILDAGCGSGYSTALILEKFQPHKLYAIDVMPEQVEVAKERGMLASVSIGDIADTEFPSEQFDAVFTFGVFHHVPEWPKAVEEMVRVLKPGGVLVGGEIAKKEENGDFEWERFAEQLEEAGLKIIEAERIYFGYFRSFLCRKPISPPSDAASEAQHAGTQEGGAPDRAALRWSLLAGLVFAIILVPFLLFGHQLETWTESFVNSATGYPGWIAAVLGSLLAVDILLPLPSSLISTAAGFLLGLVRGLLTSWIGMTASCIIGFWLGKRYGRSLACKIVGENELERLEALSRRVGSWVIVITRPVPMLAEAAVLFAGMSGIPMAQFLLLTVSSNLGISAVYAAVGALSADANTFLLAFAGSILIPLVAMLLSKTFQGRRPRE